MASGHTRAWVPIVVALITGLLGGGAGQSLFTDRVWPENNPPQARINVTPDQGRAPLEVSISADGSHDPDGDPLNRRWSIDGELLATDGVAFTYTFSQAKTYSVSLLVRDPDGLEAQAAKSVLVEAGFTLGQFIEQLDRLDKLIDLGEMRPAIRVANFILRRCKALGPVYCAKVHSLKGKALIGLNRLNEARQ